MKNITGFVLISVAFVSCNTQKTIFINDQTKLKFVNELDIPYNQTFQNTTIGGLSGIDYDRKHNTYYLISDDRSEHNPARFYSAKISFNTSGIDSVQLVGVHFLKQPNGNVYPNSKQDPYHTPDPEAIRYNAKTNQLVWSSEGERMVKKNAIVLTDPSVNFISTNGNYKDSLMLPANLHMQAIHKGPRQNGVLEGMSFTNNYKSLFVNAEEPLYEDGPRAGLKDSTAWIRIIRYDVKTKKPLAQYGYQIDPVAFPADPPEAFKINGVPDILAINNHQLLVIERSFSTGRKACTIKVYVAELNGADDISNLPSIKNVSFHPMQKKLLLNMNSLGIYTDNIEGMTLGPKLPDGHQSLIFIADNNFSANEISQLLLFEIL